MVDDGGPKWHVLTCAEDSADSHRLQQLSPCRNCVVGWDLEMRSLGRFFLGIYILSFQNSFWVSDLSNAYWNFTWVIQHLGVLAYIFLEVIPKKVTIFFFLKTLMRVLGFFLPPGVLLACFKITSYFEQEACKYPYKTGFPLYTADLRINVRCKLLHFKCIPSTKKDVSKDYHEIISAENVYRSVHFNFLNTEVSCSHINAKITLAKMC